MLLACLRVHRSCVATSSCWQGIVDIHALLCGFVNHARTWGSSCWAPNTKPSNDTRSALCVQAHLPVYNPMHACVQGLASPCAWESGASPAVCWPPSMGDTSPLGPSGVGQRVRLASPHSINCSISIACPAYLLNARLTFQSYEALQCPCKKHIAS